MLTPITKTITQQLDDQRKVYDLRAQITKVNPVSQRENQA